MEAFEKAVYDALYEVMDQVWEQADPSHHAEPRSTEAE